MFKINFRFNFSMMLRSLQDKDIKLLRMFSVIAKHRSFAGAQVELGLSQSAISTQMSVLETRLGFRLCERGHGNFKLTTRGKKVLIALEKLSVSLDTFISDMEEFDGELKGEFKIGIIDNSITIGNSIVVDAIKSFTEAMPEVEVKIKVGNALDLQQRVTDDLLDCAIGLFNQRHENLKYTALFTEEHLLYCSKSNELFSIDDEDLSNKKLEGVPYVSWDEAERSSQWKSPYRHNISASSSYIEGAAYLILSGKYIGYLPTHYAKRWIENESLRPLKPKITSRKMMFELIQRKTSHTSRFAAYFIQALTS